MSSLLHQQTLAKPADIAEPHALEMPVLVQHSAVDELRGMQQAHAPDLKPAPERAVVLRSRIQKAMKLVRITITPPYSAAAPQHRRGLRWCQGQRSVSSLVHGLKQSLTGRR